LEANFGDDPDKPFSFDIAKCPNLIFPWKWEQRIFSHIVSLEFNTNTTRWRWYLIWSLLSL
jgi:hypothetical protein